MAVCTSIVKVKEISQDIDVLKVTIDDTVEAYMIYMYAESLVFLNQEVIVSYRKDLLDGKIETFINTLTIPVKVNTLDRDDGIKLYVQREDNNSNCCLYDICEGESMVKAILYCISTEYESSVKAVWLTLKVRDRAGRVAKLRLFDYDNRDADYSGTYIQANIKRTKYGFNTDMIEPVDLNFAPNPEVDIAKTYITRHFGADVHMTSLLNRTRLLDFMEEYVELEKGYALVRAAIELDILQELKNTMESVNFKALEYAVICRYGYMTKSKLSNYSERLRSITFVLQNAVKDFGPDDATNVLLLLDENTDEDVTPDKRVLSKVIELADAVIQAKKAV